LSVIPKEAYQSLTKWPQNSKWRRKHVLNIIPLKANLIPKTFFAIEEEIFLRGNEMASFLTNI
jgi:hypothetical protein